MILSILLLSTLGYSPSDSVASPARSIDEVVVVSARAEGAQRSPKGITASIDEHLSVFRNVNLVRRGAYAWEPVVNNMATERVSTTIDGMKIFYACTDKMDPVTSYVESANLQSISLNSGLNGNPQSTGNIGGSVDLKLRKAGFGNGFNAGASKGFETNGNVQVYEADAAWSGERFYVNGGLSYRRADNYKEGGGRVVDFSQFRKVNAFSNTGLRLSNGGVLEHTLIYDRASDVGYPALNMDVSKAEAVITSLSYRHTFSDSWLEAWDTKGYYNHITHIMDDTKRPDVEIHMDMPGKSSTAGLYSLLTASTDVHQLQLNYDLYYNRLFADMTMYPGGAAPMYMVTWPDVGTLNTGAALTDVVTLGRGQSLRLSAKVAQQWQKLNDEEGYHALRVFFPGMKDSYYQTTGRVAAQYAWESSKVRLTAGAGWGSRAPTVTEAYGYYLNNTFDQYDYIGNPRLKNESATEVNASVRWQPGGGLTLTADANAFLFSNYIIGQFERRLSAMTVGAEGVKVYGNLSHATIINTSVEADWQLSRSLRWHGRLTWASGRDDENDPLPLISPVAYRTGIDFSAGRWTAQVLVEGNGTQTHFGEKYGETRTDAYTVAGLNGQYHIPLKTSSLTLRAGVENLFDKRYTSYSDWRDIPQKGRNVYASLVWTL
ncbi:MAG: TonB-dependent receptor [Bacteroidaceae bacterium]|nr:TonB-dependent receptor [Bacteroidaceae bacterium]